jgi:hypothetical protein
VATGRVVGLGQRFYPLSGEGLGESDTVAAGLAEVGVVQKPVDDGGGQGLGHEFVESGGVQIRADRDAAAFVGCGGGPATEPDRTLSRFGEVRGGAGGGVIWGRWRVFRPARPC